MNLGTLIGFVAALVVLVVTILMSLQNTAVIFDLHAALIVIGGTITVALICFPFGRIKTLFGVFFRRLLGKNRRDYMAVVAEIVVLSEAKRKSDKTFESAIATVKDPFLRDAANVLHWLKSDVSAEELRDLLDTRVNTHYKLYTGEAKVFRTLAKFPPAFGLMGTTLGMIALLQSLGSENSKNMIGPAMAIALVATLYGLILANLVFNPIAENLQEQTQEDLIMRSIVVEGIMLIQQGKPTKYVEEKVKSYLLPKDRGEGGSSQKAA